MSSEEQREFKDVRGARNQNDSFGVVIPGHSSVKDNFNLFFSFFFKQG